jgi:hypothetical protein
MLAKQQNNRGICYETQFNQDPSEVEKDLLSFYTNAIAYLMKWFNFSDENYLSHCPV